MDAQVIAILSLLETLAGAVLSRTSSFTNVTRSTLFTAFVGLFVAQYLIVKLYRIFIYPFYFSPLKDLPTPGNNDFLIGQLRHQFFAKDPISFHRQWVKQWPNAPFIRHFGLLNSETLLATNLEATRDVLGTYCYSFQKPSLFKRFVQDMSGIGLLFAEGQEHHRQRKTILGSFTAPSVRKMVPIFLDRSQHLVKHINDELDHSPDGVLQMLEVYAKATFDIIGVTAFGTEFRMLENDKNKLNFDEMYLRMFEQNKLGVLIGAINIHIPVRKLLPFVKANTQFLEASQEVRRMIRELIIQRIENINAMEKRGGTLMVTRDLLSNLVEERLEGPEAWTVDEMEGHLMNFMAAGHETTAAALSWATFAMANHPDIQEKLRAEVMDLLARRPEPDYADLGTLKYMHNFLRETTRHYSPSTAMYREATTDLTICGQFIPKGTLVLVSANVINKSPDLWGPTADEFNPDRFDNLPPEAAASSYSHITFSGGPRGCIGKRFAYAELKSILINVLSNFRFVATPEIKALNGGLPPVQNPSIVLRPRDGMMVKVERL